MSATAKREGLHLRTYDQAEYLFQTGRISEDEWSGYQHAWQTSSGRMSTVAELYKRHDSLSTEAQNVATQLGCCKYIDSAS